MRRANICGSLPYSLHAIRMSMKRFIGCSSYATVVVVSDEFLGLITILCHGAVRSFQSAVAVHGLDLI